MQSEVVIGEAMHYVITADVLRVPWIAVKAYSNINEFKWKDWALSLGVTYNPVSLAALYDDYRKLLFIINDKSKYIIPGALSDILAKSYIKYQNISLKDSTLEKLESAKRIQPQLSRDNIFHQRVDMLLERLEKPKSKYDK